MDSNLLVNELENTIEPRIAELKKIIYHLKKETEELENKLNMLEISNNSNKKNEEENTMLEEEHTLLEEHVHSKDMLNLLESQIKSILPLPEQFREKINQIIKVGSEDSDFKLMLVLNHIPENTSIEEEINKWFLTLSKEEFDNVEVLNSNYLSKLRGLGIKAFNDATLSSVIFTKDVTLVTKFGETPIYKYNDGEIEMLEFLSDEEISSIIIDNNDYQSIVLYSEGKQEDLVDDRIKIINSTTDREKLALELLEPEIEEQQITIIK